MFDNADSDVCDKLHYGEGMLADVPHIPLLFPPQLVQISNEVTHPMGVAVSSGTSTSKRFPQAPAGCKVYRQHIRPNKAQRRAGIGTIEIATYLCSNDAQFPELP